MNKTTLHDMTNFVKSISLSNTIFVTHLLSISFRSIPSSSLLFSHSNHFDCSSENKQGVFQSRCYRTNPSELKMSSTNIIDSFSSHLTLTIPSELKKLTDVNDHINDKTKVNIIMGNEAGDADSIISSLALAFVYNKIVTKVNDIQSYNRILNLPLVSINKDDMKLRRDVVLILRMAGICNYDDLLYLDDPIFQTIISSSSSDVGGNADTSITLVDHNKIRSDLMYLDSNIVEIIDHHQDEGFHTHIEQSSEKREIAFENQKATAGSTCTLITERLMKNQTSKVDAALGIALLCVILLDTMNMNPEAGKGTDRDENAINYLMQNVDWYQIDEEVKGMLLFDKGDGCSQPDREKLFHYLQNSKFDRSFWKEMSARDALRIDYKRFEPSSSKTSFGLSSVLLASDAMLAKDNFYETAVRFIIDMKIDFLGVLCMVIVDDKPQRELILIGKNQEVINDLSKYLVMDESTKFLDISMMQGSQTDISTYSDETIINRSNQGNPKGSRKQVAPVILSYFEQ